MSIFSFGQGKVDSSLYLKTNITGKISPKSVVHNGYGLFFAQNMMYRHTVTVYDRDYNLVKTIKDKVVLSDFGYDSFDKSVLGSPVECAFSHNGKFAWVSNYNMSGGADNQFKNPGCDNCSGTGKYDSSFIYKINTQTLSVEGAVKVGAVPKYLAVSPDNQWCVVSNWSSGDVSIVDLSKEKEVKRVKVGTFPRGIVIDSKSEYAYVTVMGKTKVARISLSTFVVDFIDDLGKGPRHLCMSPDNKWLYLTLNTENRLAKINLNNNTVVKAKVGHQPRSMTMSKDGKYLYLVNYNDNTFSKIRTSDLATVAITPTKKHPIGITYDDMFNEVWVACYSGTIQVFKDSLIKAEKVYEVDKNQEELIATSSSSPAGVANFGESKDTNQVVALTTPTVDSNKYLATKITLNPIRRLYFDYTKKLIVKESPEEESTKEVLVEVQEVYPVASNDVQLKKSDKYLVIVGSFKEEENASEMILIANKKGLNAEKFQSDANGLNYVFVYSSNNLEDAKNWASQQLFDELEYWVKKQ